MDRAKAKRNKLRVDSIIGNNIKSERILRRMSRDELAEIMGLTVSHMGLIERGVRGATAVTLEKLSQVFDVPIDTFYAEPGAHKLTLREDGNDRQNISRKKIASLLTRLTDEEHEFVIHIIKGLIALKHNSVDS